MAHIAQSQKHPLKSILLLSPQNFIAEGNCPNISEEAFLETIFMDGIKGRTCYEKWPLYCPQGSGTLRQQLLMTHGIAWYCMALHCIA